MLFAVSCLLWWQLEKLVATRMVLCATKGVFIVNDQTLPLLTNNHSQNYNKMFAGHEPRSRTGMAWGGRGFWGSSSALLLSQLTHSQELGIFQSALPSLSQAVCPDMMNVPVVHKQTCLFLST